MAYDKVVDSAALEAALKASADAIRGKTGGTGTIPWDAVKGFSEAIAAIEAGGGSGGGGRILCGTITTSEAQSGHTVLSPIDFTPTFAAIIKLEAATASKQLIASMIQSDHRIAVYQSYYSDTYSYAGYADVGMNTVRTGYLHVSKGNLRYYNGTTTSYMDGTYFWIATE